MSPTVGANVGDIYRKIRFLQMSKKILEPIRVNLAEQDFSFIFSQKLYATTFEAFYGGVSFPEKPPLVKS